MKTITNETVTRAARDAFQSSKAAGNDDGIALEVAGRAVLALVGDRTGFFDAESMTWTFDETAEPEIDLWADNGGGLAIVCRETGVGFRGFERGQNERRLRARGRDEFTFASDAVAEHFNGLDEGSAYELMTADDIEALYEREGETNAAVRVATYDGGEISVWPTSIGSSARWYLDTAVEETV